MKLLFDQNLSSDLVRSLSDLFPQSVHVKSLGMMKADDRMSPAGDLIPASAAV